MSKEDIYKKLTKTEQEYIDFLLDCKYANGFTDGQMSAIYKYQYANC